MKYLSNLNLNKNELQNARIQNLATAPSDPVKGQIYFNTASNELYVYNGTVWDVVGKEVLGGTYITIGGDGVTINHDNTTRSDSTSAATASYGGTFTVVDSVTTNATGHITAINVKTITMPAQYVHPSYDGDDIDIDTGALTGATVISDIDLNVTTDSSGHVTDANATIATRTLTLADLGYTGATDANNYVHPSYDGDDIDIDTGALTGATVISDLDFNVTTDAEGHVVDANATIATRTLTLANLGYTGATDANNYVHPTYNGDDISVDTDGIEVIDTLTVTTDTQGHVTAASAVKRSLPAASASVPGIVSTGAQSFAGDKTFVDDVIISGDLTVNGTVTTLSTETVTIEDNIILINSTQTGTPATSLVSGLEIERGTATNYQFVFVELTDEFKVGEVGDLQPVLTRDEVANLAANDILVWDNVNQKAIGKTLAELSAARVATANVGNAAATSFQVTHNFNSKNVTVAVYDNSDDAQVFTDILANNVNYVTVNFAVAPGTNAYRVVITG